MTKLTKELLTANIKGQLDGLKLLPIALIGERGIGKSSIVKQAASDIGVGLMNVSIPSKSIEYFTGIPNFIDDEHAASYSMSGANVVVGTRWSVAELIVTANRIAETKNGCVILLDDIHKMDISVTRVMYQLLLERSLGDFKLSDNVALVAAGNNSEAAGMDQIDTPILDRLSIHKVYFNFDSWMNNYGKNLHHYISSFLRISPSFTIEDEGSGLSFESTATPRSWEFLSNDFNMYSDKMIRENNIVISSQKISSSAANSLAMHIEYINQIDFSSIIKSKKLRDVSSMKVLDKVVWSYILNYAVDPEDAIYIIRLMNMNSEEKSFIGFISSEIYNAYMLQASGKEISVAQQIIIAKMMGTYETKNFKLSKKLGEEIDCETFKNRDGLMALASKYII